MFHTRKKMASIGEVFQGALIDVSMFLDMMVDDGVEGGHLDGGNDGHGENGPKVSGRIDSSKGGGEAVDAAGGEHCG